MNFTISKRYLVIVIALAIATVFCILAVMCIPNVLTAHACAACGDPYHNPDNDGSGDFIFIAISMAVILVAAAIGLSIFIYRRNKKRPLVDKKEANEELKEQNKP